MLLLGASVTQSKEISLRRALESARANNSFYRRTTAETEAARADGKRVQAAKLLPMAELDVRAGVVPGAEGDVLHSSTGKFEFKDWGPFFQSEIKLVQPIYTFGRLGWAETATDELFRAQSEKGRSENDEFDFNVIKSYWSVVFAERAQEAAEEMKNAFDSLSLRVEQEIEKEDSELDQSYSFEVKSNEYIVKSLYNSSRNGVALALKAFSELTGELKPDSATFATRSAPSFDCSDTVPHSIIEFAYGLHPQIAALEAALRAIEAKINLSRSDKMPTIFAAGGVEFGWAGNRTRQDNPFVYDNFNYLNLGAFLGAKWNLNFRSASIEEEEWQARHASISETLKLLKAQIGLKISKAYLDAKSQRDALVDVRSSLSAARSWVEMAMLNFDDGFGEPERLVKAISTYLQLRGREIETEFAFCISLAELAFATGNSSRYVEWAEKGRVEF